LLPSAAASGSDRAVTASRCVGVLLAGGSARRFRGMPKGLALVDGLRIADRALAALRGATERQLVVANDPHAARWVPGLQIVRDAEEGLGPLHGLRTALAAAEGLPVIVVAWDMPFVPTALLSALRDAGQDADVAVPESDSRRGLEPLCAYYAPPCVSAIERRIAADDRRVIGFFDDVRVARVPVAQVARFGDPARLFMNVNTPEERILAEAHGASTDGGRDRQEAQR
jgi:molybdopterin-guanine dinucleotide biosynthesis protein A